MNAVVFERLEYLVAHTRTCLVIIGKIKPEPIPLRVQSREWAAGTVFTYLGGKNSSAGFETLDFVGLTPFTYVGIFENLDGRLACFRQGRAPIGGFFAFHETEDGLIFGTDADAGRIIEMTAARVLLGPNEQNNSGPVVAGPSQQEQATTRYYEIKYVPTRRRAYPAGRANSKGGGKTKAAGPHNSRPRRSDGTSPQRGYRPRRLVEAT